MMFRREKTVGEPVTVGAVFRRVCIGEVVETARVISVSPDSVGITHVRYTIHYGRADASDEMRTLALSSFAALFRERVVA